jgi:hypothetical protein
VLVRYIPWAAATDAVAAMRSDLKSILIEKIESIRKMRIQKTGLLPFGLVNVIVKRLALLRTSLFSED